MTHCEFKLYHWFLGLDVREGLLITNLINMDAAVLEKEFDRFCTICFPDTTTSNVYELFLIKSTLRSKTNLLTAMDKIFSISGVTLRMSPLSFELVRPSTFTQYYKRYKKSFDRIFEWIILFPDLQKEIQTIIHSERFYS